MLPTTQKKCPNCGYWRMFQLQTYTEDDINESATVEGYGNKLTRLYLAVWLVNLFAGKAKVAHRKKRLRAIRAEILPRAPKSLICPSCMEVLERF